MISSKSSKQYKDLKNNLENNKDLVFIEGKKLLEEAKSANLEIDAIYTDYKEDREESLTFLDKYDAEIILMKNYLIASLYSTANKPTSDELVFAVAKKPKNNIDKIFNSNKSIVLFEEIQDPGNLGVIVRSALAFGLGGIVLTNNSVNPYNQKVIRSSAGNIFKIPIEKMELDETIKLAVENNYKLVATSSTAEKDLSSLKVGEKYMFVFGNEGKGLSKEAQSKIDEVIKIPQSKDVESLNLSVAASIVFYQLSSK